MAEQYSSIKLILDKILRHPLMQDITLETAVDYCIDFMRIVGTPSIFEEKTEIIKGQHIENYHANMYGIKEGKEILFTKDHCISRANGGKNNMSNYQTMCFPCNKEKGKNNFTYE